jgi:hypothetical protein
LPLFSHRSRTVVDLIPGPYLHGPLVGVFDLTFRELHGEDALVSANIVSRLKNKWNTDSQLR